MRAVTDRLSFLSPRPVTPTPRAKAAPSTRTQLVRRLGGRACAEAYNVDAIMTAIGGRSLSSVSDRELFALADQNEV